MAEPTSSTESGPVGEGRPLLIRAARVHACAPGGSDGADAVLLRGSRIEAVGAATELAARAPSAPALDLRGAVLTPGLTDAHVHLTEWALSRRQLALDDAPSAESAARLVGAAPADDSGWIRGRGWNPHLWTASPPHRGLLDDARPDRPVALQSHDMHALWVNSAALAAAGIDSRTPDPPGGHIERDPSGEPTGVLLERAGELVVAVLPAPTLAAVASAVEEAQAALHALGITGVHSFPGIAVPDPDPLPVLQELQARGRLRLRVLQHLRLDRLDHAIALGLRSGFGGETLRIGGVKLFLDGALGSRTAWMREPYETSPSRGVRMLAPEDFRDIVARAAAAGIAATVHAIGDAAVALALDVLADPALRVAALPHRIEHVQCCPPELLAAAGQAGIVCSVQPCHLITDWRAADRHWGAERARNTYAFASLGAGGAVLAFGSDAPVEPIDPRRGWFAAVTRTDLAGDPVGGWFAKERIDSATALRAFTVGPALAAGLPATHGALVPGARADIAAWDRDPLACDPGELLDMQCVATFVAGERVHG